MTRGRVARCGRDTLLRVSRHEETPRGFPPCRLFAYCTLDQPIKEPSAHPPKHERPRSRGNRCSVNDFRNHLQELVEAGAVAAVLRRAIAPVTSSSLWVALDDYSQSVLLRAVEHCDGFRGETTRELLGWLRKIAIQLAMRLRRAAHPTMGLGLRLEVADPPARSSPAQDAADAETRADATRWLAGQLAGLSVAARSLLHRRYWGGESLAAIAQSTGESPNTVTQRHGRLLRRLRK